MYTSPQFFIPVIAGTIIIGIGFFVGRMNWRSAIYQRFFHTMLALGGFSFVAGFFNIKAFSDIRWYDLILWEPLFIPPTVFLMLKTFPSHKEIVSSRTKNIAWGGTLFFLLIMVLLPRSFAAEVGVTTSGLPVQIPGPLYVFYIGYYFAYFGGALWSLFSTFHKTVGKLHAQMSAGIVGILISIAGTFSTNLIAPWFGYSQFANFYWLGPLFAIIGAVSMLVMLFDASGFRIRIIPILAMALALMAALIGHIMLAPTVGLSIFSAIILTGITLLTVFLVRDVLIETEDRIRLQTLLHHVEKANEELRRQDEVKNEFLSIASHHLRTPLTLIKWTLTELLEGNYGALSSRQKNLFHELAVRNEQLVRFVHSLLDVSKIEAGTIEVHRQEIALAPFLQNIVSGFTRLAEENKITVIIDIPPNSPSVRIDPEAMKRVFENIIENAIIYNIHGGQVSIALENDEYEARVRVTDTGIGIEPEYISRIGEKFFRSPSAKKHAAEGTGLGVFSARQILLLHGGDLSIHSEQGKGTTVEIKIPLRINQ